MYNVKIKPARATRKFAARLVEATPHDTKFGISQTFFFGLSLVDRNIHISALNHFFYGVFFFSSPATQFCYIIKTNQRDGKEENNV